MASLQPMFKMVSRNTIKSDTFKIYDVEKEKLQKWLNQIRSRVAITTDMWTSNQKRGYMSIIGVAKLTFEVMNSFLDTYIIFLLVI